MNEFLLALWAMTASHHQWEMPKEPPAIVEIQESAGQAHTLDARERRELRMALNRAARCATGRLVADWDQGWYAPEERAGCK
jgi:hypothetical protein